MSNKTCIVIPARFESTRLEGKVIMMLDGKPMIQWVYEAALKVNGVSEVIIATDHNLVEEAAASFGARCELTSKHHASGTDRIAEVAQRLSGYDVFINLQADEPLIHPLQIQELIQSFKDDQVEIATQKISISSSEELFEFNVVKVVCDTQDKVLYFSRNAIPAVRDFAYRHWMEQHSYFKHVGLYGFRRNILLEIAKLKPSALEKAESLEQLRWLENGYTIHCKETSHFTIGVDTLEDLERAEALIQKRKL